MKSQNTYQVQLTKKLVDMHRNCQDCVYFGSGETCDYILIHQKRRPCEPGDKCTVKVEGKKPRRTNLSKPTISHYDEYEKYMHSKRG